MKSLYLNDIVSILHGKLMNSTKNLIIRNATLKLKHVSMETLYFDLHRKEEINPELFEEENLNVIVTDKLDNLDSVKDYATIIKVKNKYRAYWKFVDYYRSLFDIPVIGITGTCGKTTTKEMIKYILSNRYRVQATYKSNNGLDKNFSYLLGINDRTEAAVFEMGVGYPKDLLKSCRYFKPGIRMILNIGVHHIAECKTLEGYINAKAKILEGLDPIKGKVILNADDENIKKIDISKYKNVIYFGLSEKSDFRADNIQFSEEGMNFTLIHESKKYPVYVPGYGSHNVYNAIAAIAAVHQVGMSIEDACSIIEGFKHIERHLEFLSGIGGCTIIDDFWSTSALSIVAALEVLNAVANSKKKVAILGHITNLGLGKESIEQHLNIGNKVFEANLDMLIIVGKVSRIIGERAIELGMDKNKIYFSDNGCDIHDILKPFFNEDTIILFKVDDKQPSTQALFEEIHDRIISSSNSNKFCY